MSKCKDLRQCKTALDYEKFITSQGGETLRQSGSHRIYRLKGGLVVVPQHNGDLAKGTKHAIAKAIAALLVVLAIVALMVL